MDDHYYHDLLAGRRRGSTAVLLRAALRAASVPYSLAVRLRNRAYDLGLKRAHRVDVPVVSVGNLTLGGTGKTPLVEYLARWFRSAGLRVCILSRGYGSADGAANDEARVLAENLPDVPHLQSPDRVTLARRAIDEHRAQVLILDDGFQHRRLARDLDLVVLDALDPLGGNHLFPRGLLREPFSSLRRADLVVLNRADLLTPRQRRHIHDHCAAAARRDQTGTLPWIEIAQRPCGLIQADTRQPGGPVATLARSVSGATAGLPGSAESNGAPAATAGLPGSAQSTSGGLCRGLPTATRSSAADDTSPIRPVRRLDSAHPAAVSNNSDHTRIALDAFPFRRVAAFCGIGNPAGFRRTLESLGWHVVAFRTFPDHHAYTPADVASLAAWSAPLDVDAVVTTQKDLVKLDVPTLAHVPLYALAIEVTLLHGADLLHDHLAAIARSQGVDVRSQGIEESRSQGEDARSQGVGEPSSPLHHHHHHSLDSSTP